MQKKKLFLASSSELIEDRKEFEIFINRKNKDWVGQGVFLELIVWEDFLDAVAQSRLQDEYNKAIRDCDIFVMLFCTKVGKYTEEEFETAFGQFKATHKPLIFTYFKEAEINTGNANKKDLMSLWAFQEKLDTLGHFYTRYKNIDGLRFQFNQQLDKLAASGFIELNPKQGWTSAKPPGGESHLATLSGRGAIAQGKGAKAVGERGVIVEGNMRGNINTGSSIDTGGGAHVTGNVTAGRDFIGRDKIVQGDHYTTGNVTGTVAIGRGAKATHNEVLKNSELHAQTINVYVGEPQERLETGETGTGSENKLYEDIRLDVASPSKVVSGVEFDVAVAIKQPSSPALAIADLDNYQHASGIVERDSNQQIAKYRVEIKSSDFAIDPASVMFNLKFGGDSEVKWFKLIAKRNGKLSFIVHAYQVADNIEIASNRIELEAVVESRPNE